MTITLEALLKDSAYKLGQFKPGHIHTLQAGITLKDSAKKPTPYVTCLVRGKPVKLTPEDPFIEPSIELGDVAQGRGQDRDGSTSPVMGEEELVSQSYGVLPTDPDLTAAQDIGPWYAPRLEPVLQSDGIAQELGEPGGVVCVRPLQGIWKVFATCACPDAADLRRLDAIEVGCAPGVIEQRFGYLQQVGGWVARDWIGGEFGIRHELA